MRRMMKSGGFVCLALLAANFAAGVAQACPMCAETVAADSNLPRAYMYSIIFMLTVPSLILTGFAIAISRIAKNQQAGHYMIANAAENQNAELSHQG